MRSVTPAPKLPSILLVDDSSDDLFLAKRLLGYAGVTNPVVTFDAPRAALAVLSATASSAPDALPCIILSDLNMPDMDGIAFLRVLRATPTLERIPFAILTGTTSEKERKQAEQLGALAFLSKFPAAEMLGNLVREAVKMRTVNGK